MLRWIARSVGAIHPFYTASVREFQAAGREIVGSAPVGFDGTAAWLEAIGVAAQRARAQIDAAKQRLPARHQRRAGVQTASRAASPCPAMKARS
jgi:hypothetical protein